MHAVVAALFLLMTDTLADTLDTASVQVDVNRLIRRAQAGDKEAVAMLYKAYARSIYRYVVARVRLPEDAEDITGEVFVTMVKGLAAYKITESPFAAWLYRIAASRIVDFYRSQKRHPVGELNENVTDDLPLPEDQILEKQSIDKLRGALMQLSEEHQMILTLRFVDRKSHAEVAAILGKTVAAVKSAQHRALEHLTELLGGSSKTRHYLRGSHE